MADNPDNPDKTDRADETGGADAEEAAETAAARERLAQAQAGLLAALVAGAPVPAGFDADRLAVQRRALTAKRADVVAKVAPELPRILGEKAYRSAFAAYARGRPLTDGHRRDALDFVRHVLDEGGADGRGTRRELRRWWRERSGPAPLPRGRPRRLLRLPRTGFGL